MNWVGVEKMLNILNRSDKGLVLLSLMFDCVCNEVVGGVHTTPKQLAT